MSMCSSFVYGYGFYVNHIKDESILSFIKNHTDSLPDGYSKLIDFLHDPSLKDFSSDTAETLTEMLMDGYYASLREALLNAVAEIMRAETGIYFEYQSGQEDCIGEEGAILLSQAMPWMFRGPETTLTENKFIELCKKYTTELGIPNESIGDLEIEYYG